MQNLKRIIFISCFLLSNYVISGACDDYPYDHGEYTIIENSDERLKFLATEINLDEGFKVIATAHEAIHSDGVVGIYEALEKAEESALKFLVSFFMQEVPRSCGDGALTPQPPFMAKVCDASNGVLRGVRKVDMCVQDLEYPRMVIVTVGISSSYSKL